VNYPFKVSIVLP